MTLEVCCLVFTLLSANASDLMQTARFTHKVGYNEANVFAAPLVDGPSPTGELVSGVAAFATAYRLERWNTPTSKAIMLAWTLAHMLTIHGNTVHHPEVPYLVVFPVLTVQW
jgi:hypothetical protein